jgi:hypothetical protein
MIPSIHDVVDGSRPLELCVRYDLIDPQRLSTSQELGDAFLESYFESLARQAPVLTV